MQTTIGIGYSELFDSFNAGKECALEAVKSLDGNPISIAIIFTTVRHDAELFQNGIKEIIGADTRLIGGYSVGIITNDHLGYDGYQAGIMCICSDSIHIDQIIEHNLSADEYDCGKRIARQIKNKTYEGDPFLFLCYDAVDRSSGRLKINMATPLCKALNEEIDCSVLPIFGAGLTGDMMFRPTKQWLNNEIFQNTAFGVLFSGAAKIDSVIMHGCEPASDYHTVTKTKGTLILEIDNIPALDFIQNLVGESLSFEDYGFFLTISMNKGKKYSKFDPEYFSNRMCVNVNKETKAIIMVEPDIVDGTEIIFMRRSVDFDYIKNSTTELIKKIKDQGKTPRFALYITCAGRAAHYYGSDIEDASILQKSLADIPLLGFYSGVEIARLNGKAEPLDWTGVLHIISE
ncbi:MAG: FIST N-terminal domain-containing protein [Bacteroidota bacterium]